MITRSTVSQLVEKLNEGLLTSQKILIAYQRKALKVHRQFNLITQDNFNQALQIAKQCDRIRKQTKKINWVIGLQQFDQQKHLPPLFGIPISIKDSIDMQGFSSTLGLVKRLEEIKKDGLILKCLKNGGMIPFVRTNVPQLLMCFDCGNNLWGRSKNPWNKQRSPGGSSGGQAALVCSGGSPIGLGSDISGSLRIPAQFCGLYTLKPGSKRLSFDGHTQFCTAAKGSKLVPGSFGPLTRCVNDIALWMKTVTYQPFYKGKHDPYIKLRLFDDKKYMQTFRNQKLKIGFLKSLTLIQPTMAGSRALQQTIKQFEELGHEMIQLKFQRQEELIAAFFKDMSDQNNKMLNTLLNGQQPISQIKMQAQYGKLPQWIKKVATFIVSLIQPRVSFFMKQGLHQTVFDYLQNTAKVKQIKNQWTQMLKQKQIDAVLCPGFGSYAVLHGQSQDTGAAALYTLIWSILDLPVGSVPITTVRVHQQLYQSRRNDMISDAIRKSAKQSVGLPVGIQVVGLPFQQQKILGIMKIAQYTANFKDQPQCPAF